MPVDDCYCILPLMLRDFFGASELMKKVVIIGAGPAGLTAADTLLKQGKGKYQIIILEESDCIGGISRTVEYNGNRMDIGGHRFFSKDERIMNWWKEKLPVQGSPSFDDKILNREKALALGGPDPEKDDDVFLVRNRVSRIYFLNKFFDYPISMKPQTFINMGLKRTVKSGVTYVSSTLHKREENSLEDLYINHFGKTLYSIFFEGYTEKLWGRHPSKIDPSWGRQRVKGISVTEVVKDAVAKVFNKNNKSNETSLIEEFNYPKYGPGQLWGKVADDVTSGGVKLIKNAKAVGLRKNNGKIKSVVYEKNGKRVVLDADIVMSSMPVKDLVDAMEFDVPDNIKTIASGLPYRDFVTVGVLVDKLKIKNETNIKTMNNIVPDCWIYVQDTGVKLGRIQIFNNWSPYLVKDPENTVWIGLEYFCSEGDDFWNMTDDECYKLAVDELVSMGIIESKSNVIDHHREKVKKAYPAYFDTYCDMDKLIAYLNGFENLYCIGRNGQHRYNNMDHSMATAFEAVDVIVNNKRDKSSIWKVNTEQEYHEQKSTPTVTQTEPTPDIVGEPLRQVV
jgi:protoporphyrinogen oxidase